MRFLIANPTASLYNNRTQIVAALEFACLDLLGQKWGVPSPRSSAAACATACRSPRISSSGTAPKTRTSEVRTAEQLVAQARA